MDHNIDHADCRQGALFKRYTAYGSETGATRPIGTYAFLAQLGILLGDGASAMDDGAFREPHFDSDTDVAVDHCRKTSGRATLARQVGYLIDLIERTAGNISQN